MSRAPRRSLLLTAALALTLLLPASVSASNSWGSYHWARTSNPFTLKLGDNVTSAWDSYLGTTSTDWSVSSVLNTDVVAGSSVKRLCSATTGMVQVCNSKYGNNGWLGVAQIWASGSHITKATVKVNDTYFATGSYNTPAWRNLVMCQEVGHTLGLDQRKTGRRPIGGRLGWKLVAAIQPSGVKDGGPARQAAAVVRNRFDTISHQQAFLAALQRVMDGRAGTAPAWAHQLLDEWHVFELDGRQTSTGSPRHGRLRTRTTTP